MRRHLRFVEARPSRPSPMKQIIHLDASCRSGDRIFFAGREIANIVRVLRVDLEGGKTEKLQPAVRTLWTHFCMQ